MELRNNDTSEYSIRNGNERMHTLIVRVYTLTKAFVRIETSGNKY